MARGATRPSIMRNALHNNISTDMPCVLSVVRGVHSSWAPGLFYAPNVQYSTVAR
jgi:hypothetical protein